MSKYAVIRIQGKQFKVSEMEEILVDKVQDPTPEVLLVVEEKKIGRASCRERV